MKLENGKLVLAGLVLCGALIGSAAGLGGTYAVLRRDVANPDRHVDAVFKARVVGFIEEQRAINCIVLKQLRVAYAPYFKVCDGSPLLPLPRPEDTLP